MATRFDKVSIYVPMAQQEARLIERVVQIGKREKRSLNWLVIQAIAEFLEREEAQR